MECRLRGAMAKHVESVSRGETLELKQKGGSGSGCGKTFNPNPNPNPHLNLLSHPNFLP